jgi:PPM family protein phosphatase
MDQPTSIWSHCLDYATLSDVGLRRANNQDAFAVVLAGNQADFQQRGHLFMVADGMGAHAAGELASKLATGIVPLAYRKLVEQSPPEAILSATLDANQQINSRGQATPDFRGMGTTATTLVLLPTGALVAHVGDSRAYRLRGARLEQLTFDHSLVWEMQAAGQAPANEVPGYISKNIITRSLGPNAAVRIDLEGPHAVQAGDTYLLCSDGLSGQVRDDEIGTVLGTLPPAEAVHALIDLANLRGGPDNITAVVVRVLGPQVAHLADTDSVPAQSPPEVRPIHPLVWMVGGVACLAAAGLALMDYLLAALAGLAVAAVAGVVAVLQRYGAAGRNRAMDGRRFGRGPYVAADCTPNAELLARLADIGRQLREAVAAENWSVDWTQFEGALGRANTAAESGDLAGAAREHLHAITSLMSQLRHRRSAAANSRTLDF